MVGDFATSVIARVLKRHVMCWVGVVSMGQRSSSSGFMARSLGTAHSISLGLSIS